MRTFYGSLFVLGFIQKSSRTVLSRTASLLNFTKKVVMEELLWFVLLLGAYTARGRGERSLLKAKELYKKACSFSYNEHYD